MRPKIEGLSTRLTACNLSRAAQARRVLKLGKSGKPEMSSSGADVLNKLWIDGWGKNAYIGFQKETLSPLLS